MRSVSASTLSTPACYVNDSLMKRIVLIGSNGYIGRHIRDALLQRGVDIVAISHGDHGIRVPDGTFSSSLAIPEGADAVIFLAQSPHYRELPEFQWHLHAVNVVSAIQAARAAKAVDIPVFLYMSSGSVYQPSLALLDEKSPLNRSSGYALSKIHAEEALALHSSAMAVMIARVFTVYGPDQHGKLISNLRSAVRQQRSIAIDTIDGATGADTSLRLSLVHVRDVVRVVLNLIEQPVKGYNIVNLSSPERKSIKDIAECIARFERKAASIELSGRCIHGHYEADTSLLQRLAPMAYTSLEDFLSSSPN